MCAALLVVAVGHVAVAQNALTCACGVTTIDADVCEPFQVGIRLRVDGSITSRRISHLKDETDAIWAPYGIYFEWAEEGSSEPATNRISVDALVERRFDERAQMKWGTVLGRAFVHPDAPRWRPIRLSVDATKDVLALRTPSRASTAGLVQDHELTRALGRVLAHEIGHLLLGAPYHERTGLMRAVFRPDELAEEDRTPFRLTRRGLDRLRSRLRVLTDDLQLVGRYACRAF